MQVLHKQDGSEIGISTSMKRLLRSALNNSGVWLGRSVPDEALLGFLTHVRPVRVDGALKRVGPEGDGGYLVPDDLAGIQHCISPGVSTECGFDLELAELGMQVHLADASVPGPPVRHKGFTFAKKFFDTYSSENTITIDRFCLEITPDEDLLLQMDIEGAEYRVLQSASESLLKQFRIMVIEFHDLEQLFTPFGLREIGSVFQKLLRTHDVVHIHPNNVFAPITRGRFVIPPYMEFTFYRKDRGKRLDGVPLFPNPLDFPNVKGRKDFPLPLCWYQ